MVIKPAILRSVDINYAPQGMPAFFEDDRPTMIGLSLEFVETEIHTGNDYKRGGDSRLDREVNQFIKKVEENIPFVEEYNSLTDKFKGDGAAAAGEPKSE
jgi:hypothetical protein